MIKIYGLRDWQQNLRYVGKTKFSLQIRFTKHLSAARRGSNLYIYRWIRSMPEPPTIELIAQVSEAAWKDAERLWIAKARSLGCRLVNCTDGGEGLDNPSPETRLKLSKSLTGKKASPEAIEKMAAAKRGKPIHPNTLAAITGRKHTTAEKAKVSAALSGRKHSEQACLNYAAAAKKRGNNKAECRPPKKNNKLGLKGVCQRGSGFVAQVRIAGKVIYLGYFSTPEEAGRCRDRAVLEHYPVGSWLNYPMIPDSHE